MQTSIGWEEKGQILNIVKLQRNYAIFFRKDKEKTYSINEIVLDEIS